MLGINPKKIASVVKEYTQEYTDKLDKIIGLLEEIKKILKDNK